MKCKKCGNDRELVDKRRICKDCNLERARQYYANNRERIIARKQYNIQCNACKQMHKAWRKSQKLCSKCYNLQKELAKQSMSSNNYCYNKRGKLIHRIIAESLLGPLNYNQVVHHMDDNPKNNDLTNLIVISRQTHGRLHQFLDYQRVILEQSSYENEVNCWNNLIVPMTTAWLETTSAKVIKLWEIGQSAAKPLESEEGSETIHFAPHVGDDIVQTTTVE